MVGYIFAPPLDHWILIVSKLLISLIFHN